SSLEGGLRRVTIYPNPNKGSFVVESPFEKEQDFELYNTQGKKVFESTLRQGKTSINLNLSSGVYVLKQGVQFDRIIVE
ncbi:MAG: T9SS type A sorting domain-containing protein, partial [Bacteroidota bacterium]